MYPEAQPIVAPGTASDEPVKKLGKNAKKKLHKKNKDNSGGSKGENIVVEKLAQLKVKPKNDTKKKEQIEETFAPYWTLEQVEQGLKDGTLISGSFRINKNHYMTAYITHPKGGADVVIEGTLARNRALESDIVIVRIIEDTATGRTGEVVYISVYNHSRTCVGSVKDFNINHKYVLFSPRDSRFPRMRIQSLDWPDSFRNAKQEDIAKVLYYARLTSWSNIKYATGTIIKEVGKNGDIEVETKAILLENDLDSTPHDVSLDKFYTFPYIIPKAELDKRLDYRQQCVFTIDPLTAKDLDDAVSCEELENGNYKIGVHISDVAHFLKPCNDLDNAVAFKATSIYMVESVYHMLPKNLCTLCSLLPGQERLAFSVFWEITKDADIISSTFAKTVINSCTQLAYEHAQLMLETHIDKLNVKDFPQILHNYKLSYISRIVNILQSVALKLRRKRFNNGALKIDQPKLSFKLNAQTCLPEGFSIQEAKDSNKLIEEFMILANMTVAKYLYDNLPKTAFLRAHQEPQPKMLKDLQDFLKNVDINLNIESSGMIQQSLLNIEQTLNPDVVQGVMLVINSLCSKAMTRAHYFCASDNKDEKDLRHYALSIDRYTHFTSPIRRYADIIVHRQLAHVLGIETYDHKSSDLDVVAGQCNKNKYNAKKAGEMSCELFLNIYIAKNSPLVEDAVILDIKDRSIDVIIVRMNLNKRIYYESFLHAKYDVILNSSNKKVIAVNVQWDKRLKQELMVTEYYQKSLLKNIKQDMKKKNGEISDVNLTDAKALKLFTAVKVVVCGKNNNLFNVDVFLLP